MNSSWDHSEWPSRGDAALAASAAVMEAHTWWIFAGGMEMMRLTASKWKPTQSFSLSGAPASSSFFQLDVETEVRHNALDGGVGADLV